MKKTIELADTTFHAHRKRDGAIALHLKTYLIAYADAEFRARIREARPSSNLEEPIGPCGIEAFMNGIPRCWLQLPKMRQRECQLQMFGLYPADRFISYPTNNGMLTSRIEDIADEECALFHFWVKLIVDDAKIERLSIAKLKLVSHLNFPGRPMDEKVVIQKKVPITRGRSGW